jgi:hypothetical protein
MGVSLTEAAFNDKLSSSRVKVPQKMKKAVKDATSGIPNVRAHLRAEATENPIGNDDRVFIRDTYNDGGRWRYIV